MKMNDKNFEDSSKFAMEVGVFEYLFLHPAGLERNIKYKFRY